MSLEIHVTPLWQHWCDEVVPPEDRDSVLVVRPFQEPDGRGPLGMLGSWVARGRELAWRRRLSRRLGRPVTWSTKRGVAHSSALHDVRLHWLRAFAADSEDPAPGYYRDETFQFDGEATDHPSLEKVVQGGPTSYAHLIRHSDFDGCYLPIEMDEPLRRSDGVGMDVGSSLSLARELAALAPAVQARGPRVVRIAHDMLSEAAGLSVSTGWPLIFDG